MKLSKKNSQMSIFLIVCTIIIITTILLIIFTTKSNNQQKLSINNQNPSDYIKSCYTQAFESTMLNVGFHAGFFIENETLLLSSLTYDLFNHTYHAYIIDDKLKIPSIDDVKQNFNQGIKYNFDLCLRNYSFLNLTYNISSIKTETDFSGKNIISKTTLNIQYQQNNITKTINRFTHNNNDNNLLNMLNIATELALAHKDTENYICLTCIDDIAKSNDVFISNMQITSENEQNQILIINRFYIQQNNNKKIKTTILEFIQTK